MTNIALRALVTDITKLDAEAIVNAANESLLGGGGVNGAIHCAAGPDLLTECRRLGGCDTGHAKITGGYKLPAKYVIHTVGPVWRGGDLNEADKLSQCYRSVLKLTQDIGIASIAFPAISCGAYNFPAPEAVRIAVKEIHRFPANGTLKEVTFACFSRDMLALHESELARYLVSE